MLYDVTFALVSVDENVTLAAPDQVTVDLTHC